MTKDEARKIVFEAKPRFAELFQKYRHKKWPTYIEENYPTSFKVPANFNELEQALQNILSPLLGKQKTYHAIETLRNRGFASTADHSGVLCHPFFSNSALVRSESATKNDSVVCFTCGGVSLTNSSYPRGIFFHDSNLKEIRIPFVSLKGRRRSVFGLKSFQKERIEKNFSSINHLNISENAKNKLQKFFSSILDCEKFFEQKKYSDQLVILNDLLWQNLFESNRGNLIYIEAENIVRKLLLDVHLDQNTFINKIIFEKDLRKSFMENFENIVGAHNTKKLSGSHIFWYIDEKKNMREQIFLKDNRLETRDRRIQIELQPEILRKHLENYTLLPSMAFCYGILAFYYGLTLGGGFSQIKYLGDIKNAWKKTAEAAGESVENPRTDVFSGEFVLAGIGNGTLTKPASLIDILLYGQNPNEAISKAVNEVSIGDSIDAMMDEFVEIITTKKEEIDGIEIHKTFFVE